MKFWIFLLFSASLCANQAYFQAFPALREEERWEEIIALGEAALASGTPEAAKIHGQLASSYFYRGEFGSAEYHARACYEKSCLFNERAGQIHGLYLLSATARARGEFSVAKAIARLALPLTLSETDLRAKVLFNLGAAEGDDPQGDLEAAKAAYLEAISIFESSIDRQRCAIRLSKIYLLTGDIDTALSLLNEMGTIQCERIAMHADYLKAQVEKALGSLDKAEEIGAKALETSRKLGAKRDEERIASFLKALRNPS